MKIVTNSNVSVRVTSIELDPITFIKNGRSLAAITSYRWLDDSGNTIRQTNKAYTKDQLVAAASNSASAESLFTAISTLFVDGINPELRMRMRDDETVIVFATHAEIINGIRTQVQKQYQEEELISHGLSSPVLSAAIQEIALSLTNS